MWFAATGSPTLRDLVEPNCGPKRHSAFDILSWLARVFLSYSHQEPDQLLAQELFIGLSQKHEVFIDTKMAGGTNWGDFIDQELRTADFLIPLISARSVARPMVVAEISAAHDLNVKRGKPGIIPIRLDQIQLKYPITAYVSRFQ